MKGSHLCASDRVQSSSLGHAGYTLAELSVAMMVALTVVTLGFGSFLMATRVFGAWQERIAIENSLHTITMRMASDLRRGETVTATSGGWTIDTPSGSIVYEIRNGHAYRDARPLNNNLLLTPRITEVPGRGSRAGYRIDLEITAASDTLRKHLFVVSRHDVDWLLPATIVGGTTE